MNTLLDKQHTTIDWFGSPVSLNDELNFPDRKPLMLEATLCGDNVAEETALPVEETSPPNASWIRSRMPGESELSSHCSRDVLLRAAVVVFSWKPFAIRYVKSFKQTVLVLLLYNALATPNLYTSNFYIF